MLDACATVFCFLSAQYSTEQDGDEEHFGYEPTEVEKELMWQLLEDCSQQKYGCSLEEFPAVFQKMCQSKNEVTLSGEPICTRRI